MEIKMEKIAGGNFGEFGSILNPSDCGDPLPLEDKAIQFYPDRLPITFLCSSVLSLCLLILKKRPFKIDFTEAHEYCEELIGGFNEDVVFNVGPPSEKPDLSQFKAFFLPKYHFCRFKRKVWHGGLFVIDKEQTQGWVILPPYTYLNDVKVINLDEPIKINLM